MEADLKRQPGFGYALAIWLLVFAAGWFVMLTELVGARVLSPFFGNTIYVWGSVIGIFLLAMAIGYAIGGRLTSRRVSPLVPAIFAGIAGLYVAGNQVYAHSLCAYLYSTGLQVKWTALIAASVLYGIPMVLLGGISPYCIHLATQTRLEVGHRAGTLYALSTIGSFVGCLVTAFVLIPSLSLSQITLWAGLALAIISAVVGVALTGRTALAAMMSLAIIVGVGALIYHASSTSWHGEKRAYLYFPQGKTLTDATPEELIPYWKADQEKARKEAEKFRGMHKVLLQKETPYQRITVVQDGPNRGMTFGEDGFRGFQTEIDLRDLNWHVAEYTHMAFAALFYKPNPKRVCFIGLGGAVIPKSLEHIMPGVQIDVVDVDPEVVQTARDYFYWRPSKNVRIFTIDGRSFINTCLTTRQEPYDWIILDAYSDGYVPFHLTTKEFIQTIQRTLTPDGVLAANLLIDNDFYGCEARTFQAIFGNTTPFVGHRSGNIILVSQNGRTKSMTHDEAAAAMKKIQLPPDSRIDLKTILSSLWEGQNWQQTGPTLTDSWAPVEDLLK